MKLYPPHIEGTLPSFYKSTSGDYSYITIPFSMNKAVGMNEVGGFSLLIKDVITGEHIIDKTTVNHSSSSEVKFMLDAYDLLHLVEGAHYKVQLAYLDKTTPQAEVGYYSTVGVIKCTTRPELSIKGLDLQDSNIHRYSYTGFYSNPNDPTEKVYQYRFVLTDTNGNIIRDSGFLLHNIEENAENTYESTDTYEFPFDLEDDQVYLIQYYIKTNNNLIIQTPKYRLVQGNAGPITEPIRIDAYSNFEEGFVQLIVSYDGKNENLYQLNVSEEFDSFLNYYEHTYEKINLTEETYIPNEYYISIDNNYKKATDVFDETEEYYESVYNSILLTTSTYEPNKYYIRKEHFARGNYKITRSCKDTNYKEWNTIATLKVDGYQREFYNKNDYTIQQGKYYKYAIQQINNYGVLTERKLSKEIFADFEDLFLYDGKRQLKIRYNPKVSSFKTDILEAKIDTIGGKYPFFFRNGQVSYKEFPIAGLISYEMDNNYQFVKEEDLGFDPRHSGLKREYTANIVNLRQQIKQNLIKINSNTSKINHSNEDEESYYSPAEITRMRNEIYLLKDENSNLRKILENKIKHENIINAYRYKTQNPESINIAAERYFKMEVLDWLNDGKPKLFRSPTEGNFIVRLMNSSLTPEDTLGRMLHNFSTTAYEMANCDYDNLSSLGIISPNKIDYNFLQWRTVRLAEHQGVTNNNNGTYFVNEEGVYKTIYNGNVQYIEEEILESGQQAFIVQIQNMQPGSIIRIDDEDIVIGATGAYYTESALGINSIIVPTNSYSKGIITYNYYGMTRDNFDLITNEYISQIGAMQFIGNGEDIISQINNPVQKIKDFGYLQFLARDIVEIYVEDFDSWEKLYYTNTDYTQRIYFTYDDYKLISDEHRYFYEDEDIATDRMIRVTPAEGFKSGKTYFKDNEFSINPMLMTDRPKTDFPYKFRETYYIKRNEINTTILPDENKLPLYKYSTDIILIDGFPQELNETVIVYKDFYNDKYYVTQETYDDMTNEENKQYFEILSFDVLINNIDKINLEQKETYKVKEQFICDNLILGNGTLLNCAYQVYHKTFAFEDSSANVDSKYYNEELANIKARLDEYEEILDNSSALTNNSFNRELGSIVEYYKSNLLDKILEIQTNTTTLESQEIQKIVGEYTNFLTVYERYLDGEISTIEEFIQAVNSDDARDLKFLLLEASVRENYAREQYQKDYKEYIRILTNLLEQYEEEDNRQ